jgi:hypothetical protein
MFTESDIEFELTSPDQFVKISCERYAIVFEGDATCRVAVVFASYHPLGVVVPPFGYTVSKYWVLYVAASRVSLVMMT